MQGEGLDTDVITVWVPTLYEVAARCCHALVANGTMFMSVSSRPRLAEKYGGFSANICPGTNQGDSVRAPHWPPVTVKAGLQQSRCCITTQLPQQVASYHSETLVLCAPLYRESMLMVMRAAARMKRHWTICTRRGWPQPLRSPPTSLLTLSLGRVAST